MKVLIFNGPKAAYNTFAAICVLVIIYFGFFAQNGAITASSEPAKITYLAVIIDDFGNATDGTKEFMYMDIPFTGAVMPNMPKTQEESRLLIQNGKDVILHMPMEANTGKSSWLPEGSILSTSTAAQAKQFTQDGLSQVSGAIGINNHMGSKIMEDEELMREVLTVVKDNNLFFVDSMTTNKSCASKVAEELGVKVYKRDVFLDGTKDVGKIEKNLKKAAEIAQKSGYAIAIGHVGQEGGKSTAQAMKNLQSEFEQKGVRFVTISELIAVMDTMVLE